MSDVSPPVSIPNHVPYPRPDADLSGGPVTGSAGVSVPMTPAPSAFGEPSPGDRFSDVWLRGRSSSQGSPAPDRTFSSSSTPR